MNRSNKIIKASYKLRATIRGVWLENRVWLGDHRQVRVLLEIVLASKWKDQDLTQEIMGCVTPTVVFTHTAQVG